MSILQLINLRQTVMDSSGKRPLIGGVVHVREPNTVTPITSYVDSGLSVANVNPVVLNLGKASIWVSKNCDIRCEDVDGNKVFEELEVNPDDLTTTSSSGLVPNGSFEIDTDTDDEPDGWTKTDESGSTNILDTSKSTDGAQSMKFSSTGSGGGNLINNDFFPVVETEDLKVNVDIECSVVDIRVIVRVEWFDISQVSISNSDPYDNAASNPTSWASQNLSVTPPANARFAKLRLIGADPSDATPGDCWFDNAKVFYPQVESGVFDNVTIAGNAIITTNTNGDLDITPDGTGSVKLGDANSRTDILSTEVPDLTDNSNALNIGALAGIHVAHGGNDIQAKTDATTAGALDINPLGGVANFGGGVDVTGNIVVSGTVDARDVAADGAILDTIETGADVTDTANVTAAGALMDSEVDADLKTFALPASTTISAFGASLVDAADAAAARVTLGSEIKVKTADQIGIDDSLIDDTHLAGYTLDAASYYEFEGYFKLFADGNGSEFQFLLQADNAFQLSSLQWIHTDAGGNLVSQNNTADVSVTSGSIDLNVTNDAVIRVKGTILTHATLEAEVDLQWAHGSSGSDNTTMEQLSWLGFTKIP